MSSISYGPTPSGTTPSIWKATIPATPSMPFIANPDTVGDVTKVVWLIGGVVVAQAPRRGVRIDLRSQPRAADLTAVVSVAGGEERIVKPLTTRAATAEDEAAYAETPSQPATTARPGVRVSPTSVVDGDLTVTTAGQVVEGVEVRGRLRIKAPGVVVRDVLVRGRRGVADGSLLAVYPGDGAGALVEHVTVEAAYPSVSLNGVAAGEGMTLRAVDVSGTTDGVVVAGSGVTVEDSWIHGLQWWPNDPAHSNGSHSDAIQVEGGSNIAIRRNVLDGVTWGGSKSCQTIMVTQNYARIDGLTIEDNMLSGSWIPLNVSTSDAGRPAMRGIVVRGNAFRGDQSNPDRVQAVVKKSTFAATAWTSNVLPSGADVKVFQPTG